MYWLHENGHEDILLLQDGKTFNSNHIPQIRLQRLTQKHNTKAGSLLPIGFLNSLVMCVMNCVPHQSIYSLKPQSHRPNDWSVTS